jgi:hypothetical protein
MSHKEKRFDSIVVDKKNIQLNQMLNKALGAKKMLMFSIQSFQLVWQFSPKKVIL